MRLLLALSLLATLLPGCSPRPESKTTRASPVVSTPAWASQTPAPQPAAASPRPGYLPPDSPAAADVQAGYPDPQAALTQEATCEKF